MNAPTDRDLILRAKRGESEAYGEIVTRHQTSVFNVCYRILHNRNDAEDLAQETFMRAYDKLETFDIEREFGAWIRRVAANVCFNFLESQKTSLALDEERDQDKSPSPSQQVEVKERSEQIRQALASLPSNYRLVVEMRHYQEMSYDEIAHELKIPLSDVKSHLFRARKILAEKLHAPNG
ncbi:MAG: ECF subfamily RNA polymerase sigma-24 factor [Chloroflexi bacterium OLB14]|nr:MAG: ECF subfamily RNA polymerase sigma-24 factor [Chloroflexi bacterium OLB14]